MGYRSEVIIGIKRKYTMKFEELLKEHDLENAFESTEKKFELLSESQKWVEQWAIYKGDYLKWYDGYKDVDAINSFVDKLNEKENSFMICMGEDGELHNEVGDYSDFIEVIRTIEII